MAKKPLLVSHPFTIDSFKDGHAYRLPTLEFIQPHLFSRVGYSEEVVVKYPSRRGFGDYRKFVQKEKTDPDDIRGNEPCERFSNLNQLIDQHPQFRSTRDRYGSEIAHYLLVHLLQKNRFNESPLTVPETRFVVLSIPVLGVSRKWVPALIQKRVSGTSLWDMFSPETDGLRGEWQKYKPGIADSLRRLLDCSLRDHINWNIENLIFNSGTGELYYVDLKPSTMFSKVDNEHNIRGLRGVFI